MLLSSGNQLIYLCSPYVTNVNEVLGYNLRMNSFPMHDATRDLVLLNQQRLNDVDDKLVVILKTLFDNIDFQHSTRSKQRAT